jgi:hypothetical protein
MKFTVSTEAPTSSRLPVGIHNVKGVEAKLETGTSEKSGENWTCLVVTFEEVDADDEPRTYTWKEFVPNGKEAEWKLKQQERRLAAVLQCYFNMTQLQKLETYPTEEAQFKVIAQQLDKIFKGPKNPVLRMQLLYDYRGFANVPEKGYRVCCLADDENAEKRVYCDKQYDLKLMTKPEATNEDDLDAQESPRHNGAAANKNGKAKPAADDDFSTGAGDDDDPPF